MMEFGPQGGIGAPMGADMGMGMDPGMAPESADLPQQYKDLLSSVMSVFESEQDEEDRSELTQIIARLQKLIARNQADTQALVGGNPALSRVMRKL